MALTRVLWHATNGGCGSIRAEAAKRLDARHCA